MAIATPRAEHVARSLLWLAREESKSLTHLHVQKLLFYVQGWSLCVRGRPAFTDPLEAWVHGAVAGEVYEQWKEFGGSAIPTSEARVELDADDLSFVRSVWREYRGYSAEDLREMNHRERSWLEARGTTPPNMPSKSRLNVRMMAEDFRQEFERRCKRHGLDPVTLEASIRQAERGALVSWADTISRPPSTNE